MESPVRKMQKRNDYNRHKLLRKIKRRRKAAAEQQAHAAEKALKKKLRVTPPKYGDGKDALIYKNKDGQYVDSQDRPIEQIGWTEDGRLRFRDVNGNVGSSWDSSQGAVIRGTDLRRQQLQEGPWEINEDRFRFDPDVIKNDVLLNEYFSQDVYPRFSQYNNDTNPFIADVIQNAVNRFTPSVFTDYDSAYGAFNQSHWGENNKGRTLWFDRRMPNQRYNLKYKLNRPTVVHEVTHGYRQGVVGDADSDKYGNFRQYSDPMIGNNVWSIGSGYSDKEIRMLENYGIDYFDNDYNNIIESGTTNAEVRYRLWRELKDKSKGRTPSTKELDRYIKNYDNNSLIDIIGNANAYGANAVANAKVWHDIGSQSMDEWIKKIKRVLRKVAKSNSSTNKNLNHVT